MGVPLAGQKGRRVPIDYITNGIHVPTWIEPKMELLFDKYLGPHWLEDHDNPCIWQRVDDIPDEELWQIHHWLKIKLINFIRERARKRWIQNRVNPINIISRRHPADTIDPYHRFCPTFCLLQEGGSALSRHRPAEENPQQWRGLSDNLCR